MVSTIASLIRENGNAIRALATSMSQDGKKYLYKDILVTLGLPVTSGHIRALSKFLNKEGIRRREPFTRKRSDHPEIPALILDEMQAPDTPEAGEHGELFISREAHQQIHAALGTLASAVQSATEALKSIAELVKLYNPALDD